MRLFLITAALILSGSAMAQDRIEPEKKAGDMMGDAVTQPLSDVNLKKKGVPPLLLGIRDKPYDLSGIRTCRHIIAEVQKLDSVLGEDFDRIETDGRNKKRKAGAAAVTSGIISSLIPFRALIREVSGARSSDTEYREAVYAGVVRRSYLKGLGTARRCRAPGRPLTALESAQQAADEVLQNDEKQ
jgi:hypothetical protein